jgi:hypothetical protein
LWFHHSPVQVRSLALVKFFYELQFFKKKIIYKLKIYFMSRYRGPKLRISRRLGALPGLTTKKSNKINRPGKDGNANADTGKKLTEYGVR